MIKIGTRGSALALWQANFVASQLKEEHAIVTIKTKGDRIQNVSFDKIEGKGFFTKELEEALLSGTIDMAVHSMKDLPTDDTPGLAIAAVTKREDPSDVIIIRPEAYRANHWFPLKENAKVGTSSLRRVAQLKRVLSSTEAMPLRGNVPTRIRRLREGKFDAIILAKAGLKRLGIDLLGFYSMALPFSYFLPSPGQGALAIQVRSDDKTAIEAVKHLHDAATAKSVQAERQFLKAFGAGCHVPLGAFAHCVDETIILTGVILSVDGTRYFRHTVEDTDPTRAGDRLARFMIDQGAEKLL
ncbi:MAG: hydroxymethylbilane synthase [Spirochaetota bacterium]